MSFKVAGAVLSSTPIRVFGPGSTNVNTSVISPYAPMDVAFQGLSGVVYYLSHRSNGTTADSFKNGAFAFWHFRFHQPFSLHGFTSAGVTCAIRVGVTRQ